MSKKTIWIIAITLLAVQTWLFCKSTSVTPNDLGTRVVLHSAEVFGTIFTTSLFAAVPTALIALIPFRKRNYRLKFKRILPISIGCISALLIISFYSGRFRQQRNMRAVPMKIEKRVD